MLNILLEGIVLGLCIVFVLISVILLAKFVKDGVVIALTPLYVGGEEEEDNAYVTEAMPSVEPS